jgi:hypothetical protein
MGKAGMKERNNGTREERNPWSHELALKAISGKLRNRRLR